MNNFARTMPTSNLEFQGETFCMCTTVCQTTAHTRFQCTVSVWDFAGILLMQNALGSQWKLCFTYACYFGSWFVLTLSLVKFYLCK